MPELFTPYTVRGLTLRNRTVVAPMCQYSAKMGLVDDWHLVHLGRFAIGGFGLVFVEATAVTPEGRISYADTGIWSDAHVEPLARIAAFIKAQGAAAGIQLAHSGRKGSTSVPWRAGVPETEEDKRRFSYEHWTPKGPSAVPHAPNFQTPDEMTADDIAELIKAFQAGAERALTAGFDVVELHCAHGYLLNEYLSPLANKRTDHYGGSLENRMRLPLECAEAIRAVWPEDKPLFARFSVQDWAEDGWQVEDSVILAREMKARGVDVIDCSSGGFAEAKITPAPAYQLPLSEAVRSGAGIATMAVGLMDDPHIAEEAVVSGKADLIAVARPALDDPNWPAHTLEVLDPSADSSSLHSTAIAYAVRGLQMTRKKFEAKS